MEQTLNIQDELNILLAMIVVISAYYIYQKFIRRYTTKELGEEDFNKICKYASPEWVTKAKLKGLTRQEWINELEKQKNDIGKELENRKQK